jgi:hypothetical protein
VSVAVPAAIPVSVSSIAIPVPIAVSAVPVPVPVPVSAVAVARSARPARPIACIRGRKRVVTVPEGVPDMRTHSREQDGYSDAEQRQQQRILHQALATAVPDQGAPRHMGLHSEV